MGHLACSVILGLQKNTAKIVDENITILKVVFRSTFQEVELKPGGHSIIVTNDNRIEYIHLMADYRLNKQVS